MDNHIYQALREEILCNYEQENTLTQFVYTAAIATLGLAITVDKCWLAFMVPFSIMPMSFRIADIRYSTAYIAAYIKTYLEDKNDVFSWENMHYKFERKYSNKRIKRIIYNTCRIDFGILTLISNVLFWFIHGFSLVDDNVWKTIAVVISQVIIVVFESYLGIKYANLKNLKNNLIPLWEHLNEESANKK